MRNIYILRLFLDFFSSVKIIIISFIIEILILFSFIAVFHIDNLIKFYEQELVKSFTGNLGEIFIYFEKKLPLSFMSELKEKFNNQIVFFDKKKLNLEFNGKKREVIVYIYNKQNNLMNSLLSYEFPLNSRLKYKNREILVKFIKFNSGFLNNEPIIFLNEKVAAKLTIPYVFKSIAVKSKIDKKVFEEIILKIEKLNTYDISFKKETIFTKYQKKLDVLKQLQNLIRILDYVLFFIIFIIVTILFMIFFTLKKYSLKILNIHGLSVLEISIVFSGLFFVMICLNILIAGLYTYNIQMFEISLIILLICTFCFFVFINKHLRRGLHE